MTAQLDSLFDLVSPQVGLVKALGLRVKSADEPDLPFIYDALLSHFDFRKGDKTERGACGKGLTEEEAMLGALGEGVERYCASHPSMKGTRRATIAALDGEAISPVDFVLYSDAQYARADFAYRPWQPGDEVLWKPMTELGSKSSVWVPAGLVYLNAPSDQPQDYFCPTNSNGFAAGPDLMRAVRSGILELLEREAFLVTWLNRLPVPEINFAGAEGVIGDIRRTYERGGAEVKAYLLATDMPVCAVMALVIDRSANGPAAMIGLGCELNGELALRKALFEICQLHELLRRKHEEGAARRLNNYADVRTMEEHAAYFFRLDHFHEFDFLLESGQKLPLGNLEAAGTSTIQDDLATLQAALAADGCRVLYADVTTPELEAYPIRVARVLATHIQPLHFGYGLERLGCQRLYELPKKLGYRSDTGSEKTLNPCPHPLA